MLLPTAPSQASPSPPADFRRGGAHASGALDITDAIVTLQAVFLGTPELPCEGAADSDDSDALDQTDALGTLTDPSLGGVEIPDPGLTPAAPIRRRRSRRATPPESCP